MRSSACDRPRPASSARWASCACRAENTGYCSRNSAASPTPRTCPQSARCPAAHDTASDDGCVVVRSCARVMSSTSSSHPSARRRPERRRRRQYPPPAAPIAQSTAEHTHATGSAEPPARTRSSNRATAARSRPVASGHVNPAARRAPARCAHTRRASPPASAAGAAPGSLPVSSPLRSSSCLGLSPLAGGHPVGVGGNCCSFVICVAD